MYQNEVKAFVEKHKELIDKGYELVYEPVVELFDGGSYFNIESAFKDKGPDVGGDILKSGSEIFEQPFDAMKMEEGLGAMKWGVKNDVPLKIYKSSKALPYSSAGLRYLLDLLCGNGLKAVYRYVKNAGGEFKERFIPFEDAGTYLWDKIKQLRKQLAEEKASGAVNESLAEPLASPLFPAILKEQQEKEEEQPVLSDDKIGTTEKELERAIADYRKWEQTNAEFTEFWQNNDMENHFQRCMSDCITTDLYFSKIALNRGEVGNWNAKIVRVDMLPVVVGRFEKKDEKLNINHVYHCEAWRGDTLNSQNKTSVMFPLLGPKTERYYKKDVIGQLRGYVVRNQKTRPRKRKQWFVVPVSYASDLEQEYYPQPHWWCLYTSLVMTYASTFIFDKTAARQNSTMWGKIIYINHNYLERIFAQEGITEVEKMKERRAQIVGQINTFLRNRANNGKTVALDAYVDDSVKQLMKAVEIVDVPQPKTDTASQEEFNSIISIIAWAMGIHSSLLADKPGASNGGTFQRELYLLKQSQMSSRQRAYIKHIEDIFRFNGWDPHLRLSIVMPILTTLDNSKTGVVEENRTS